MDASILDDELKKGYIYVDKFVGAINCRQKRKKGRKKISRKTDAGIYQDSARAGIRNQRRSQKSRHEPNTIYS